VSDPFPAWFLSALAAVTVCSIRFGIGIGTTPRELLSVWWRPGVTLRAPLALRRSLDAGGHPAFAPGLQISILMFAVVSMPLSVAVINHVYGTHGSLLPLHLMKQVVTVQLLPLGLGVASGWLLPRAAAWLRPRLERLGKLLLLLLLAKFAFEFRNDLSRAGTGMVLAMVMTTAGALGVGHVLGGPEPGTRSAVAVVSAARNLGLALLTATLNAAPAAVTAVLPVYSFVSAITMLPYILWRRRRRPPSA
jgi:BASS family bile acid:Na+ symporter